MRTTPPTERADRVCVVCGRPVAEKARATTMLCRVCMAQKAQAAYLAASAGPRPPRRKTARTPSILHKLRRRDDGAG